MINGYGDLMVQEIRALISEATGIPSHQFHLLLDANKLVDGESRPLENADGSEVFRENAAGKISTRGAHRLTWDDVESSPSRFNAIYLIFTTRWASVGSGDHWKRRTRRAASCYIARTRSAASTGASMAACASAQTSNLAGRSGPYIAWRRGGILCLS